MKKCFSLAFLFLAAAPLFAHYSWSPNLLKAQEAVFQLRIYDTYRYLNAERKADPSNRLTDLVDSYADCSRLSIDEDRKLYKLLLEKRERLEDNEQGHDKSSPWYLFIKAESALQWALVKLKFQDYLSAVMEVRSAYSDLGENIKRFPSFQLNYKSMGVLKTLIGTVPDQYHWVLRLVGMEGSIEGGRSMLLKFIQAPVTDSAQGLQRHNARMQYAYLTYHVLKDKPACWRQVDELTRDYRSNLFSAWNRASFAMKCGHTDEAIEVLMNRPSIARSYRFDYLDYLLGVAKIHRLDEDADVYLKKYLEEFKGENYLKDACLKLYWHYLLHGDRQQALQYRDLIPKKGFAYLDEDKHAEKAAKEEQDVSLLQARLLFDGGYYPRALTLLRNKHLADFPTPKLKTEFHYRMGRILHEMGESQKAVAFYLSCIQAGEKLPYYYAANSCLQLGYVYEKAGDYEKATYYLKKSTSLSNTEYRNSISQKAKMALKRIEERK